MTATDVFFCSVPQSDERDEIAQRCLKAWLSIPNLWVRCPTPITMGCTLAEYNRQRRVHADAVAVTPIYILTDDDMLPPSDIVVQGLTTMMRHPDFAILSAWPDPATINRWTPEGYRPYEDDEVMEHVSVGGLRFCRKGPLNEWPLADGSGYDMEQAQALRKAGYRVGYMKHVRALHLGEGKTELWAAPNYPLDMPSPNVPTLAP